EPPDRIRLEQLRAAIDRPRMETFTVPMPPPTAEGGRPALRRPETSDEETEGERGDELRERAAAVPEESPAQRAVNMLLAKGGTVAEAQLTNLDCSAAQPTLTVKTELGTMKILIDEPSSVSV